MAATTPQGRGRYPDHDVLAQAQHWDALTREVVTARVADVPPLRFFDEDQARTLGAFLDVALAQDGEPRVPVLAMVDADLHMGRDDGYRFHDMPPDPQTWREVAAHLDATARAGCHSDFATAPAPAQHDIVQRFSTGDLDWEDLPSGKAWSVVMRGALTAFYSHPWAWNEIGFAGPAYPRGYARLGAGQREPWETAPRHDEDPVREERATQ